MPENHTLIAKELPEEIVIDLLSMLPVKSLLRFRCVCKRWCSLISESRFVKLHRNRSIAAKRERILVTSNRPFKTLDSVNGSWISDIHSPLSDRKIEIVGTCTGLVCLLINDERLVMYNPSTRKHNELPNPPEKLDIGLQYGFGYDSCIDDYKVVVGVPNYLETKVFVLNLKDNYWRALHESIVGVRERLFSCSMGTLAVSLNGALHWICTPWSRSNETVSFGISEEVFKVQPFEEFPPPSIRPLEHVGIVGGCCPSYGTEDSPEVTEIWTIWEYGGKPCWGKVKIMFANPLAGFESLMPVCFLRNGELLLQSSEMLLACDPLTGIVRTVTECHCDIASIDLYIESLVSPDNNH